MLPNNPVETGGGSSPRAHHKSTALSPETVALAERHRLGALRGAYAPRRLGKVIFALYVFTLIHLLALLIVPGLVFYWWLRKTPNFSRKQAAKRLCLFEHGMIVDPQSGAGAVVVRWESVRLYQKVTQLIVDGLPAPTKYVFTAIDPSGAHVRITEFYNGPESWGPWMQNAVVRAQHHAKTQDVLAGRTVDFGTLSLSADGVSDATRGRLAWPEVTDVTVKGGRVYVMQAGQKHPWANREADSVANLHLFLTMAEDLGPHRSADAP
ncbi:DUF6585 family protein [Streptomyces sp. NPDC050504]|uniref:DUF6585 family protein n=1 Tax=Streptomyces sp. NPDC050504 TaxID=3365618 RepID=UPI0037B63FEB